MAKLRFNNGRVEDYTIVLSTRDKRHLGQLYGIKGVVSSGKMNAANELSFSVYKEELININHFETKDVEKIEQHRKELWENIVDFKLVWIKELDEYYEINVSLDDSTDTYKTITATSLCEAELSQTNLYSFEINTDADIDRVDYEEATVFYNKDNPKISLLNRALDKAPHYKIKYVDESLCNLQRTFSVDGTSIYDFFIGECSEQFDCLFQFDTKDRSISVYDLLTVCKDCGERGEYIDECQKCKSKNLKYYGQDTTIYIDKTNLTDEIHYEENPDNVKNCFKLEAGDDTITAAVIGLNPNGSDYIYINTEEQIKDMPKELVTKLEEYNALYNSYLEEYEGLLEDSYQLIDDILYLEHSKMPTIEQAEVTAQTEVEKLNVINLSPVSISSVTKNTAVTTVNSALKNYAKVYVKTGYVKLTILDGATFKYIGEYEGADGSIYHKGTWKGQFEVTNYSDEEDVATTKTLTIEVNDDYHTFMEQKIAKAIASDDDEGSIFDVLNIGELEDFNEAIKEYSLARVTSFHDAIQGALDVLIQADQASDGAELYEILYQPYYQKLKSCEEQMSILESEIEKKENELTATQERQSEIQQILNFKKYLGDYYSIYCAYKREDKYSNSNYISDGLDNAEVIKKAKEFWEVAKKELEKSSGKQITISSTLYNLLTIREFQPLVDNFELGNWLRIRVDGNLYRLRLIDYEINFDDLNTINVTFSTITKIKDFVSDVESVISSAQSMATSYGSVMKQAEQGSSANNTIDKIFQDGLNSASVNITNNKDQTITMTSRGLLGRAYDDITDTYSDEQLIISNNILGFTSNNWKTVECALGKHDYTYYDKKSDNFVKSEGYGLSAKFLTAPYINGGEMVGSVLRSSNYSSTKGTGTIIDLDNSTFNFGNALKWDGNKLLISSGDDTNFTEITKNTINVDYLNTLKIKAGSVDAEDITGTTITGKTINGGYLLIGNKSGTYAEITSDGILNCNGATMSGTFNQYATNGYKSISIADNRIDLYSWNDNGDYVGSIAAIKDVASETVGIAMYADGGERLTLGYYSEDKKMILPILQTTSTRIENGETPFIANTASGTIMPITNVYVANGYLDMFERCYITVKNGLITDWYVKRYTYNQSNDNWDEELL